MNTRTKIHHSFAANSATRNTTVKLQTGSNSGYDILTRDPETWFQLCVEVSYGSLVLCRKFLSYVEHSVNGTAEKNANTHTQTGVIALPGPLKWSLKIAQLISQLKNDAAVSAKCHRVCAQHSAQVVILYRTTCSAA